jgi:uncharacterized membrane protein
MDYPSNRMNSRKIAIIAMLAALSIGTNYALLPLFNVKFMDFIVFVGGFCFGPFAGALIGVISWGIYGSLNPLGFSFPVWLSTMFGEAIFGVAGGLTGKFLVLPKSIGKDRVGACVLFGVISVFLTFSYDLVTNAAYAYAYGINLIVALIVGFVPFGIAHLLSNAVFFGLGCVPTINSILKVTGGEKTVSVKK